MPARGTHQGAATAKHQQERDEEQIAGLALRQLRAQLAPEQADHGRKGRVVRPLDGFRGVLAEGAHREAGRAAGDGAEDALEADGRDTAKAQQC